MPECYCCNSSLLMYYVGYKSFEYVKAPREVPVHANSSNALAEPEVPC
jgi:hypothetical protein